MRDRVAHQYQIAGGRVALKIATQLPPPLDGIGLFRPNAEYIGIGRISTGLGCPHLSGTPFGVARLFAYQNSQDGREALPEADYAEVFRTGVISGALIAELTRRRSDKQRVGHIDSGP